MKDYKNVIVFDHPLIRHKIAILRNERTSMKEFRELIEEITTLMTYESLKDGVPTTEIEVKTPLETCRQQIVYSIDRLAHTKAKAGGRSQIHTHRFSSIKAAIRSVSTREAYRRSGCSPSKCNSESGIGCP